MKLKHARCTLLATALLAAALSSHAQSWETILQLDSPLSGAANSSRSILIDPTSNNPTLPNLLVAGQVDGDSVKLHRLLQVPDPVECLRVPLDAGMGTLHSIATDLAGQTVYTAGEFAAGSSTTAWAVRRSVDQGLTWTTPSAPFSLGGTVALARGITVTAQGVAACGFAQDAAGYMHWVVGTSGDGGTTWTYKKVFSSSGMADLSVGSHLVQASGMAQGADGSLFVVGSRGTKSLGKWTVTKSRDGGNTWSTVDSWLPPGRNASSRARKVAVDSGGRIFVLGDTGYGKETDPSPWVVRMSNDGGANWSTIFGPWSFSAYDVNPLPMDLTVDVHRNVWLAGGALEKVPVSQSKGNVQYAYLRTALVVRLENPANPLSVTWTHSVSAVSPVCEYPSLASSITSDAYGRVYVNGRYRESATGPSQWFVKRLVTTF